MQLGKQMNKVLLVLIAMLILCSVGCRQPENKEVIQPVDTERRVYTRVRLEIGDFAKVDDVTQYFGDGKISETEWIVESVLDDARVLVVSRYNKGSLSYDDTSHRIFPKDSLVRLVRWYSNRAEPPVRGKVILADRRT